MLENKGATIANFQNHDFQQNEELGKCEVKLNEKNDEIVLENKGTTVANFQNHDFHQNEELGKCEVKLSDKPHR